MGLKNKNKIYKPKNGLKTKKIIKFKFIIKNLKNKLFYKLHLKLLIISK